MIDQHRMPGGEAILLTLYTTLALIRHFFFFGLKRIEAVDNLLSCFHYIAVFVYSMPGYKCPIKDRMLYSTCKGPLLDVATGSNVELEIGKKV